MYIFGIHVPFTSTEKLTLLRDEMPSLNFPVEVIINYQQGNYITELPIEAVLRYNDNNYYWEGTCGIAKDKRFTVSPNDKWKYVNNI